MRLILFWIRLYQILLGTCQRHRRLLFLRKQHLNMWGARLLYIGYLCLNFHSRIKPLFFSLLFDFQICFLDFSPAHDLQLRIKQGIIHSELYRLWKDFMLLEVRLLVNNWFRLHKLMLINLLQNGRFIVVRNILGSELLQQKVFCSLLISCLGIHRHQIRVLILFKRILGDYLIYNAINLLSKRKQTIHMLNTKEVNLHNFVVSIHLRVLASIVIHAEVFSLIGKILLFHVLLRSNLSYSSLYFTTFLSATFRVCSANTSLRLVEACILFQVFIGLFANISGTIRWKLGYIYA